MNAIELLKCYMGDLSYHAESGFDSVNYFTSETPSFDNDAECKAYIEEVGDLIKREEVVDWDEVLRLVDMLTDTVARTTDLENIYGDDGDSMSWDEAMDIYQRIVLRASDDESEERP